MKERLIRLGGLLFLALVFFGVFLDHLPFFSDPIVYPGRMTPKVTTIRHDDSPLTACGQRGKEKALKALSLSFKDPESAWRHKFLEQPQQKKLKKALEDFENKKRGQSVVSWTFQRQRPEEIHQELLQKGFTHKREPITLAKHGKIKHPIDFYLYKDGGVIRIKPEGTPIPGIISPEPQLSKIVLFDNAKNTSFKNEAFKISTFGKPIPKSPASKQGFRHLHHKKKITKVPADEAKCLVEEDKAWTDTLMQGVHWSVPTDFAWPKQECKTRCYEHDSIECRSKCPFEIIFPQSETSLFH